jgi:hypothetical protein
MSLREFLNNANEFEVGAIKSGKMNIGGFIHESAGGKYVIRTGNTKLLHVDEHNTLQDSAIKTYVDNVIDSVDGIQQLHDELAGDLDALSTRVDASLTTIRINIANLQQRATIMEAQSRTALAYVANMRRFMNAFSQSVNMIDPETGESFDFTNLI